VVVSSLLSVERTEADGDLILKINLYFN